jgi:hypothetical protein
MNHTFCHTNYHYNLPNLFDHNVYSFIFNIVRYHQDHNHLHIKYNIHLNRHQYNDQGDFYIHIFHSNNTLFRILYNDNHYQDLCNAQDTFDIDFFCLNNILINTLRNLRHYLLFNILMECIYNSYPNDILVSI